MSDEDSEDTVVNEAESSSDEDFVSEVFPIRRLMTSNGMENVSWQELRHFAKVTEGMSEKNLLDAMFTPEAFPITYTECNLYAKLLFGDTFESYYYNVLLELGEKIAKENKLLYNSCSTFNRYGRLKAMEKRLNTLYFGFSKKTVLELKEIEAALAKCQDEEKQVSFPGRAPESVLSFAASFAQVFPISNPLTMNAMKAITVPELRALEHTTKGLDTNGMLDAMFKPAALPITSTECRMYNEFVFDYGYPLLYKAVVALEKKITKENEVLYNSSCMTPNRNKRLEAMRDRLKIQFHDNLEDARSELKLIYAALAKCQDEENVSADPFPIRVPLSLAHIANILPRYWHMLAKQTANTKSTKEILLAMFTPEMVPITMTECSVYQHFAWFELEDEGKLIIDALRNVKEKIKNTNKSRFAKSTIASCFANESELQKMYQRIKVLSLPDSDYGFYGVDKQEWDSIQKSLDFCQRFRTLHERKHDDEEPEFESFEEELPQAKSRPSSAATKTPAPKKTKNRPLGSASKVVRTVDTSKALVAAAPLRKLFNAYFRRADNVNQNGAKGFPVSPAFLSTLNQRLYEWVRDVMSFLSFTSQPDGTNRDPNLACDSSIISATAISQALEVANPDMRLSGNQKTRKLQEVVGNNVKIPEVRKSYLLNAMLAYAQPLHRITPEARQVMSDALTERLSYLVMSMRDLTIRKNAIKLGVCPALTTLGRVPHNKLTNRHFGGHAETMFPHPDLPKYIVVHDYGDSPPDDEGNKQHQEVSDYGDEFGDTRTEGNQLFDEEESDEDKQFGDSGEEESDVINPDEEHDF